LNTGTNAGRKLFQQSRKFHPFWQWVDEISESIVEQDGDACVVEIAQHFDANTATSVSRPDLDGADAMLVKRHLLKETPVPSPGRVFPKPVSVLWARRLTLGEFGAIQEAGSLGRIVP